MNTFWLKIAALAIVIVAVIILINVFTSSEPAEPPAKPKTFYDMVDRDREKFSAEPQPVEEPAEEPAEKPIEKPAEQPAEQPVQQQAQEQKPPAAEPPNVSKTSPPPAKPVAVEPNVAKPRPTKLYFVPLSEEDQIEAQRLLDIAISGRSIGRLPQTGFQLMVQTCRQIIDKWPDSWYAYRAKQMLIDMPERFRPRYKITKEELDISEFTKQRPGTEPFEVSEGGSP